MNTLGRGWRFLAGLAAALMAASALPAADRVLDNDLVSAAWPLQDGALAAGTVRDEGSGAGVPVGPGQAWLEFGAAKMVPLNALRAAEVTVEPLSADSGQAHLAGHYPGRAVLARFADPDGHYEVVWRAELRAGSRYLLIALEIRNTGASDLPLTGAGLIDLPLAGASTLGEVNGSPVIAGGTFLAVEHPLARNLVVDGRVRCRLPRLNPLGPGETAVVRAVVGFTDPGQLRRGFLAYLERERAHPYRPFLYYNTWYDIGYFNRFDQDRLAGVIEAYGRELVRSRGVKLDSFVLDDGWDDPRSLWKFHAGFPQGLRPAGALAAKFGAGIGIWLSPWGGYGWPKQERLKAGVAAGLETREGSFSLAGPRYYRLFFDRCAHLLRRDGVSYFKFDGIG
ncbi:MAG TPA: hypothetical protein VFE31_08230, partial [Opitutaceae bacterium]|nr:hypothetical protein [Opitutaceae bacterium]